MSLANSPSEPAVAQSESIDLLAAVLRFYRSALRRKSVVIACFAASFSLAGLYYLTATRLYQSRAELIILQAGASAMDRDGNNKAEVTVQMPNFERVMQSDRVLKEALKNLPDEHRIDFHDVEPERWLEQFRSRMSISTMRNTNVMSVSFRSVSPETAYMVVDRLLESYLTFMNMMHQDTTQESLHVLTTEKTNVENQLRTKERQLLEMKQQSKVIFGTSEEPTNVLSERVLELNKALVEAQKATVNARSLWQSIEIAVQNGEDLEDFAGQLNEGLSTRLLESQIGMESDEYLISKMEREILEAQSDLSSKMESLGEEHPVVKKLMDEIQSMRQFISVRPEQRRQTFDRMSQQQLGPRIVALARREYLIAHAHEHELLQQYTQARDEALQVGLELAQIELLENEVSELRKYYNNLLDVIKEKSLAKETGITAKPITPPNIDHRAVTPKLSVTVLMAMFLGLVGGGVSVYVLDFFDDRFHSPDDLRLTLNSPILAMVRKLPRLRADNGLESLYPYTKPNSVESEAFRTLRTAIDFAPEELQRLTISSTEPSDGKTTVMASLAVAFAQAGKRTLVIDGDMRRPGTTKLFDLSGKEGLSSILKDDRPVRECLQERIVKTKQEKLDVLPSGPRPVNPVELLASERMAEIMAWAETHYDQILIDAPPSLAVADVQVIGRLVDAAILTVRPDKNKRKMVIRAAEALTVLGCRMLGIVVNHVEAKHNADYAYGYGYGYGYGEGYGHDNPDDHVYDRSQPEDSSENLYGSAA
ncbi:MAG: polysaccharide biosynthesis tyrosine autokinase [Planctomycetaceae bacterium]|nr:polysaccharide biosynthesis tyrosine autokinase [Planctomycetaceae bacterium]